MILFAAGVLLLSAYSTISAMFLVLLVAICRRKYWLLVIAICLFFNVFDRFSPVKEIVENEGVVDTIKDKYFIADFGGSKVIVYTEQPVSFNDVIRTKQPFEPLQRDSHFFSFDFNDYCMKRGIYYSLNDDELEIDECFGLRDIFYYRLKDSPAARLLYQFDRAEENTSFILSAGLHVSTCCLLLRKLLSGRFSRKWIDLFVILLVMMEWLMINRSFAIVRILIFQIVRSLTYRYNEKQRLGLSMLSCMLLYPSAVYEIAFLLPVFLRGIGLFDLRKLKGVCMKLWVLLPIQLQLFHSCSLIQLLLFSTTRYIYALFFILGHIYFLFPIPFYGSCLNMVEQSVQALMGMRISWVPTGVSCILFFLYLLYYLGNRGKQVYCWGFWLLMMLSPWLDPFSTLMMLNVGQGDCFVFQSPFHYETIMIDVPKSLHSNIPKRKVIDYLRGSGSFKIDQLLISHDDLDHSGGIKELQELIRIEKIARNKDYRLERWWFKAIGINLEISDDKNDSSMVLYLRLGNLSGLFMGDASTKIEERILMKYPRLNADILKVGHHGSSTSSSQQFIARVQPKLSLISAGVGNRYGHPHEEVVKRLNDFDSLVLGTYEKGDVMIKTLWKWHFVFTSSGEVYFFIK